MLLLKLVRYVQTSSSFSIDMFNDTRNLEARLLVSTKDQEELVCKSTHFQLSLIVNGYSIIAHGYFMVENGY